MERKQASLKLNLYFRTVRWLLGRVNSPLYISNFLSLDRYNMKKLKPEIENKTSKFQDDSEDELPEPPPPPAQIITVLVQMKDGSIVTLPYNIHKGIWLKARRLPLPHRFLYQMVPRLVFLQENKHVIFLGGKTADRYLKSVIIYNVTTHSICTANPMSVCRAGHGAADMHGYVYVVGGFNSEGPLKSVERYDIDTNSWENMLPLLEPKGGMSLAALNDRLYCVGGWNGYTAVNTTECYDPAVNQWTRVACLPSKRYGMGSAAFDGHLYAAGGRVDSVKWVTKDIMLVYDPDEDRWYKTVTSTFCCPDEYFMLQLMQQLWLVTYKHKEFISYDAFKDQMIRPQQPCYLKDSWAVLGLFTYELEQCECA